MHVEDDWETDFPGWPQNKIGKWNYEDLKLPELIYGFVCRLRSLCVTELSLRHHPSLSSHFFMVECNFRCAIVRYDSFLLWFETVSF